ETSEIPVIVISTVDDRAKGMALGAAAYVTKPIDRITLLQTLTRLTSPQLVRKILIVDDDEISRYLLRQSLASSRHVVVEAAGGAQALDLVGSDPPDVICLDLHMPEVDGFQVVDRLKGGAGTRPIPIVV